MKQTPIDAAARIADLEAELRDLREMLTPRIAFPRKWLLANQETQILATIYARRLQHTTRHHLRHALWTYDDRTDKCIDVLFYRMRAKLKPFGITITSERNSGWRLEPASREIIRKAIA